MLQRGYKGKNILMEKTTLVKNVLGIHAQPAGVIAKIANKAQNQVWLCAGLIKVDATSIVDILTLGAKKGTSIVVEIKNSEDIKVLDQIIDLFETGFGEL